MRKNKNRYFIVFYTFNTEKAHGEGMIGYTCYDGHYLNRDFTIKEIMKQNNEFTSVLLTNIIELSGSDYNDFTREDERYAK